MKHKSLFLFACWLLALASTVPAAEVTSIWGGARSTIVLKSDGTVWTWGANFGGKLGLGVATTNLNRILVPAEVHGPGDIGFLNSVKAVMGGEVHNVAVKTDGTVWAWGNNMFGQLGNGTTNEARSPVPVSGLSSVIALGGRGYHTLGLKSDGSVWAWGWNTQGELGNGTSNFTTVPVQVAGLTNPVAVSAGYKYSIALMPNGTVYQWGHGRVIANSATPVLVPGLSNVAAISGGWDHALALASNGTVWAWGKNGVGELGDGSTTDRSAPVPLPSLSNIVAVSGGDWHSAALSVDGTVWKWGRNDTGQLGNGTADGASHPWPAKLQFDSSGAAFTNIVMVAARDWHNIAVKADGSVWQWGANDQGQCGNNATNDCWRPVMVSGLGPRVALPLRLDPGAPGSVHLRWQSATGEYFAIEYSTNLAAGFTEVLQSNILASPPTNTLTLPATNASRYYRLKF